jgi:hypothetical protein
MEFHKLADELIALRCNGPFVGNSSDRPPSVGDIYEFLLEAYGDANKAKADFIRFLAGDLPRTMIEAAAKWMSEDRIGASALSPLREPMGRPNQPIRLSLKPRWKPPATTELERKAPGVNKRSGATAAG